MPLTLPANTTTKAASYTLTLSATATKTTKATTTVTVAAKSETKTPKPVVTSFTASPQTLGADGGYIVLTATTKSGGLCNIAASSLVYGFPDHTTCITGSATTSVNMAPNLGSTAETYTFTITVNPASGTSKPAKKSVTVTVDPSPASLKISPTSSMIQIDGSQTYVVKSYNKDGKSLGVDTDATLAISGTGTCNGFTCTASDLGDYTVTATDGTATVDATLNVEAVASLTLSPDDSTIALGNSEDYTVAGLDENGNNLGNDTNATLAITPDGACTGYSCTASEVGVHTVTATDGNAIGQATLNVSTLGCSDLVPYADLEGCNFSAQDLSDLDLTGANLRGANLEQTLLTGTVLTGADLTDSDPIFATFTDADLTDADLDGAALYEATLTDADLTDASVTPDANGLEATLENADLSGATLTGATLRDTSLQDADMENAKLTDAYLYGIDLTNTNLTNANLTNIALYGDSLNDATLTGANLTDAALSQDNLTDADLTNATLSGVASVEIFGAPSALPTIGT